MGRRKIPEAEAREMLAKERLWARPFTYPLPPNPNDDNNSAVNTNDHEDSTAEEPEDVPIDPTKNYLENLPIELQRKIAGYLYVRPIAINPADIRFKLCVGWRDKPEVKVYSYQWAYRQQRGHDEYWLPHYDGSPQGVCLSWRETPSPEQLALIEAEAYEKQESGGDEGLLPGSKYDPELGADVFYYVFRRDGYPMKVMTRAYVTTTGIQGINFLQVNKHFAALGTDVLYGENTFAFNTGGNHPYTDHRGVHAHDTFNRAPWLVPGLPNTDGGPMSQNQTNKAIDAMFNPPENVHRQQIFCRRDGLARFFSIIGRDNASKITKVQLEGCFKTAGNHPRYRENRPIGFGQILSIHSTTLRTVCANLKVLILHQDSNDDLWSDDLDGALGKTDDERKDEFVEKVVGLLPTLQKLELGAYSYVPPGQQALTEWGKALRWEGIVEQRFRERKERKARKAVEVGGGNERGEHGGNGGRGAGTGRGGHGGRGGRARHQGRENRNAAISNGLPARNAVFASVVDNALAAAATGTKDSGTGGRPSFRKGKKRGGKANASRGK